MPQVVIAQNYCTHFLHNIRIGYKNGSADPLLTYHFFNPTTGNSLRCDQDYFTDLLPLIPRSEFIHSNSALCDSLEEAVSFPDTLIDWTQDAGRITQAHPIVIGKDTIGYVGTPNETREIYTALAPSGHTQFTDPEHHLRVLFTQSKYTLPPRPFVYYKDELANPLCKKLGMPVLDWNQLKRTR